MQAQFKLLLRIRDRLSQTHGAANQITDLRDQLSAWKQRAQRLPASEGLLDQVSALEEALAAIDHELIERSPDLTYHHPVRLNAKLASLAVAVGTGDAAPTQQAYTVLEDLSQQVARQLDRLRQVMDSELANLNVELHARRIPTITTDRRLEGTPAASAQNGVRSGSAPAS